MFLITGYGSIGSLVIERLLNNKCHDSSIHPYDTILIIDKDEKVIHQCMTKYRNHSRIRCLVSDLTTKDDLTHVFRKGKIHTIIHTAAMKHVTFCEQSPLLATHNNIIGIDNLLSLAHLYSVKKFINISTDKSAYPSNVMGATKFIAERLVLSYNSSMTCQNIRLGNVLYSNGSLIPTIVKIVEKDLTLDLTDLEATRFFISPNDVSDFIVDVTLHNYNGQILIKKLKSATLKTMVNATLSLIGRRDYNNIKIMGLRQGEKLHEHLYSGTEANHITDHKDYWSIDYNLSSDSQPLIDSSQFCVNEEEFLNILKRIKC